MSFVPVAPGKNQSYVPVRLYQAEQRQDGAGQLSGLYLLNRHS